MHVMVGVEVGRLAPVEFPKPLELVVDAVGHQTMDTRVGTEPPAPPLEIREVHTKTPLTVEHRRGTPGESNAWVKLRCKPIGH